MPELNFELAPRPGMTATQRKKELDEARFVAVRNLAYMTYRRPDNQPLMTYQETLDDRERVKSIIIQHEIAAGYLVNDLGQPQTVPAVPNVPLPTSQMFAPGASNGSHGSEIPQMPTPPMASPEQAAAAAVSGAVQEIPQPGRRRRTAAGGPAAAPPGPVASPSMPGQPAIMAPPQGSQMAFPAATPTAPVVPTWAPPAPVVGASVPVQGVSPSSINLAPVLERIDAVGHQTNALEKRLLEMHSILLQSLAALHHFYATNEKTAPHLTTDKVTTLDGFRTFLSKFSGNPT